MNRKRYWLAFWYGLATLLAQGVHDHRNDRDEPIAVGLAGCDDPRPHYSGHPAPDLSRVDVDCPACQFRAEHQAVATAGPCPETTGRQTAVFTPAPSLCSAALTRSTCRAPPLA